MLWKKESTRNNSLYIDIIGMADRFKLDLIEELGPLKYGLPAFSKAVTVKNDTKSQAKRNEGNGVFAKGDWCKSMELYNESLCLAPQRSKNIALAYANRSACFLKLKMWDECLVDIENAKRAGYPTELMAKLDQRKANCLKEKEDSKHQPKLSQFVEQLSHEPNENFPSMANVLNVKKDSVGNYSVTARQDIDVGETVAVEKAFFVSVYQHFGLKCNICLKTNTNLIACKKCTVAMFCSAECQSNRLHEFECGIQHGNTLAGYGMMRELRSLLVVINLFPNADALMNFVEERCKSADRLPATMKDGLSQYFAYFKQRLCINNLGDELGYSIAPIYNLAMTIAPVKKMFRAKKHARFLQHLIAHHSFITPESGRDLQNEYDQHSQITMIKQYFNQSCAPNTISIPSNGHLTFIAARPIKKGEELFDSTISRTRICCSALGHTEVCVCKVCKGVAGSPTPEQRRRLKSDPNYKHIMAIGDPSKWNALDDEKLQATINKCVILLKEYGRAEWCDETKEVMNVYQGLVRICFRKR